MFLWPNKNRPLNKISTKNYSTVFKSLYWLIINYYQELRSPRKNTVFPRNPSTYFCVDRRLSRSTRGRGARVSGTPTGRILRNEWSSTWSPWSTSNSTTVGPSGEEPTYKFKEKGGSRTAKMVITHLETVVGKGYWERDSDYWEKAGVITVSQFDWHWSPRGGVYVCLFVGEYCTKS